MRQTLSAAFVCASLVLGVAGPLRAQSLADVARKEEARRKAIQQPAKVYTNKDVGAAPPPSTPSASAAAAAPADGKDVKTTDKPTDKDAKGAAAKDEAPAKDQAYWSGRLKALQERLDRNDTYAAALQTRINALTADFVNRDDPAQRAVVETDRRKNIAELDRLTRTIQDDKKALTDLMEEARRAGVPPGWLR